MSQVKKKCGWCGEIKEAYAYQERDYEEVKHLSTEELLMEGSAPLKDDDVVGLPICKECHIEHFDGETQ